MAVQTYTKTGSKSKTAASLPKTVFAEEVNNHELIKQAYDGYLAKKRTNAAQTLTRGLVRGGGRKPWKQKGTGRARHGSIRSPIWRGGGITFGPTGNENYTKKMTKKAARKAIRQALTLANEAGKVKVIDTFECKDGKVKKTTELLEKLEANRRTLIVVSVKDDLVERATRNIPEVKAVQAMYLNVFDVMNADTIVISKKSLDLINEWLGDK